MASDAPGLRTTEPQPGPEKRLRPGPRARTARPGKGGALTDKISSLIAERRTIRARSRQGTGLSGEDEARMLVLDADIDGLWVELRRSRLPPPTPLPRPEQWARLKARR